MKHAKRILAMLFVAATISLAACSKDDDTSSNNGGGGNTEQPTGETPASLNNTEWSGPVGSGTLDIKFQDLTGYLTYSASEMPAVFSYTYTKPSGVISVSNSLDASNTTDYPFTVNGNKLSLTYAGTAATLTRQ
ncbi:MAG: hypothetical protein IJ745_04435 [Bacteroidales bacterium]|nr:hypothetical protein [Bacteroidales bacterium]